MKFFQAIFLCGALGLAFWGLASLFAYTQRESGTSALADSLAKTSAAEAVATAPAAPTEPSKTTPDSPTGEGETKTEEKSDNELAEKKPGDFFQTNPFTLAPKSGSRPKALMPEKAYRFERMALGSKGTRDFVLKNEGDAPLKVAKGPTMCKCTLSQVKEQEVPPGGEIRIGLEWKPTAVGEFSQNATIWTNDPDHPELVISISGDMFTEVNIIPAEGWMLGSAAVGTEKEFDGFVYSSVTEELEITELTVDSKDVVISFETVDPSLVPFDGPPDAERPEKILKAYRIKGKVLSTEIAGQVSASVLLKTNRKNYEETRLFVRLNRTGPISIVSKGWYAETRVLQLGRLESSAGITHPLTLLIDTMDEDLRLENVQTKLPFLSIELKKENSVPGAKKQRYTLFLKIEKGAPLGEWTGPKRAKISFDTNHPKVPHFEIYADFEIL